MNLQSLYLSGTSIKGTVPQWFCSLTNLSELVLSNNQLMTGKMILKFDIHVEGTLPNCLTNLQKISVFRLDATGINGGCFPFNAPTLSKVNCSVGMKPI